MAAGPWAAVAQAAAGTATGVATMAQGDDPSKGYQLPLELEIQYVQQLQEQLQSSSNDLQRINSVKTALDNRIRAFDAMAAGQITPVELQKHMASTAAQIAQAFGNDALAAAKNGFLSANEVSDLNKLRSLDQGTVTDPVLEGELADKKAALEQDLARAGVGAAGRARALADFNRTATEMRFTRSEELKNTTASRITNRLTTASSLKANNQAIALSGYNTLTGNLDRNLAIQKSRVDAQTGRLATIPFSAQAGATFNSLYGQAGQTAFSDAGRTLMTTGITGPGTQFQQTGVAPGQPLGDYRNLVTASENQLSQSRINFVKNKAGFGATSNSPSGSRNGVTDSMANNVLNLLRK